MLPTRPAVLALAAVLGSLAACTPTFTHVRSAAPPLHALPQVTPVPARAGVHYRAGFASYRFARSYMAHRYVVPLGEESVAMMDRVLPMLFEKVEPTPSFPAGPGAPPLVDLVVEPSVERFDFALREEPSDAHAVVYRMNLYAPDGTLVSTWTVEGLVTGPLPEPAAAGPAPQAAEMRPYVPGAGAELGGDPTNEPMRPVRDEHAARNLDDAARRLLAGFEERSRVREYLARRAAGASFALPLDGVEVTAAVEDLDSALPGAEGPLRRHGVVPVKVRVANRSPQALRIVGWAARLDRAAGAPLEPASPSAVVAALETRSSRGAAHGVMWAGAFGAIGGMVQESRKSKARPEVRRLLEERALRAVSLASGEAAEGFLFFLPERGAPPLASETLSLALADDDLHGARVALPIRVPPPPPPPADADAPASSSGFR